MADAMSSMRSGFELGREMRTTSDQASREQEMRNAIAEALKSQEGKPSDAMRTGARKVGQSGNYEGFISMMDAAYKMDEQDRKDLAELAKQHSSLASGMITDLDRFSRETENPEKAFDMVQFNYAKHYYSPSTDRRGLPKPEDLNKEGLYQMLSESASTKLMLEQLKGEFSLEREEKKSKGKLAAEKEKGVQKRASDKSMTEAKISEIVADYERLQSMSDRDKKRLSVTDPAAWDRIQRNAQQFNPEDARMKAKLKKGTAAPIVATDRVKVKAPDGKVYSLPRTQLEDAKKQGYTEVQ